MVIFKARRAIKSQNIATLVHAPFLHFTVIPLPCLELPYAYFEIDRYGKVTVILNFIIRLGQSTIIRAHISKLSTKDIESLLL